MTGIAAKKLNRNFIGFEKDSEYCKIAGQKIDSINKSLFLHKNALNNVSRANFNIIETDKPIIVGNPPYNDKTTIV